MPRPYAKSLMPTPYAAARQPGKCPLSPLPLSNRPTHPPPSGLPSSLPPVGHPVPCVYAGSTELGGQWQASAGQAARHVAEIQAAHPSTTRMPTCACLHVCTHVCPHVYTQVHAHAYAHACIHAYTHVRTTGRQGGEGRGRDGGMHVQAQGTACRTHAHARMHTCMPTHAHMHTRTHARTRTHAHTVPCRCSNSLRACVLACMHVCAQVSSKRREDHETIMRRLTTARKVIITHELL